MLKNITVALTGLRADAVLFGILLMCASSIPFSILDATVKYLAANIGVPVAQIIWIRFLMHVVFSAVMIGPRKLPSVSRSNKPLLQLLRSVFLLGATGFNFYALKYLQLDQTMTIFFLAPFVVAGLAGPVLGEWVGWRRFMAIVFGFSGVLLVIRPDVDGIHPAYFLAICAAVSYGCYNIATRYLSSLDRSETTQLYSPIAGLIAFAPAAFMSWEWPQETFTWVLLISLGISGGIGHWILIVAHRYAPASTLAPFVYFGLISMVITGYLIFGDLPTIWTLSGGAVVVSAGLYLLYRERKQKRQI